MFKRLAAAAFGIIVVALFLASGCGGGAGPPDAPQTFRTVSIPKRENGYGKFDSVVIGSRAELDRFLSARASEPSWGSAQSDFVRAIEETNLDFAREALVLIRHTEGSGSVPVSFDAPRLDSTRLVSTIRRESLSGPGTGDMAYYALALAVSKDKVSAVTVRVNDQETATLPVPR